MIALSNIKTTARVALAALALSGGVMAAAPAQAQNSQFGFSFEFGNGGVQVRPGLNRCLSERQLVREIRAQGFFNVYLGDRISRRYVEAFGERGRRDYLLTVDRCSGDVVNAERLRRR